jgi:hypothetical protein
VVKPRSTANQNSALLAGWQAPDLLGIGVIVCDASSRLLIANETALDILHAQDGLRLSSDGRLCESPEGDQFLADLVQRAAGSESAHNLAGDSISVAVRRSSGKKPLTLVVRSFRPMPVESSEQPMALVLLLESTPKPHVHGTEGLCLHSHCKDYRSQAGSVFKVGCSDERVC